MSLRFLDICFDDTKTWLLKHQQVSASEYHLFGHSEEECYSTERRDNVRRLLLKNPAQFWIEQELAKFKNLKSIKIVDPPIFSLPNKIVVEELLLRLNVETSLNEVLSGFDIRKIKKMLIIGCTNLMLERMLPMAAKLDSLHLLEIGFLGKYCLRSNAIELWYSFIRSLKRNTLKGIYFGYLGDVKTSIFHENISHHVQSLKILSFSSMEQLGFPSGIPKRTECYSSPL